MKFKLSALAAAAIVGVGLVTPTDAMLRGGLTTAAPIVSSALKVGAGGYITGMGIAADNTQVARTDTYGAYIWNPIAAVPQGNAGGVGAWQQLVTATSLPNLASSGQQLYHSGVYEIAISPSNSSYIFMVYFCGCGTGDAATQVYLSTNKGQTWTATNFQATAGTLTYGFSGATINPNASFRFFGPRMVVDPNSCGTSSTCTVYAGMGTGGLWKTTDSGATWTQLTNLPTPTQTDPGITGISVNPANSNIVYAASYGNGVYQSSNAGSTWTHLTSGTGPSVADGYGIASGNGNYYVCEPSALGSNNSNLWVWTTTWTKTISVGGAGNSCAGIAVSPSNNNWIRIVNVLGGVAESTNGTTFTSFSDSGGNPTYSATDIPWLQALADGGTQYGLLWDAATPSNGKMIIPTSRGIWTNTVGLGITSGTATTVKDQSVGVEQLVAVQALVPPIAGATPITCNWDSAIFTPNGTTFPAAILPVNDGQVVGCWGVDYVPASPVTQYVVIADGDYVSSGIGRAAICTIGSSCTLFSSIGAGIPANAYPTNLSQGGGNIAAADANHILFAPGGAANGFATAGTQPYFTTNGGTTWAQISIAGISSWAGFTMAPFSANPTHLICADKVGSTTFYLNFGGNGLYHSTNGGATWALSTSSGTISSGQGSQIHCTPPLGAGSTVAAGDLWISSSWSGTFGNQPQGGGVFHITSAHTGSPTIVQCSNVLSVLDVGFGAPKSGNTYPSVYIAGWVGVVPVYGIWRSDDQCSTWTQIDTWPNNSLDLITTITGDPNSWNKVYYGFSGSGYAARQY